MSNSSTPPTVRNVLFIMADQLRWDYLSCAGHPRLHTPNLDALAARGVRFANAFVQGPVCGASRMSTYTGRYVTSHGSMWNFVPLSVGNKTLGDHLRPHGVRCAVVGKTHVEADVEGAARLGLDTTQGLGLLAMQGGFEPYERDDGILPAGFKVEGNRYCDYLRAQGYPGDNPWHDFANSGRDALDRILSGWQMRWAGHAAHIAEEHSETPYMTRRAMQFIRRAGRAALAAAPFVHQAALALCSARALPRAVFGRPTYCRRGAASASARRRTLSCVATWTPNRAEASPATKCAIR